MGNSVRTRPMLRRLLQIHREVSRGAYPTSGDLAALCEVCERTIVRDIAFLRDDFDAPLDFDKKRRGYYYTDPDFSLPRIDLSEGDLLVLLVSGRVLESCAGTPLAASLKGSLEKLAEMLPESVSIDLQELGNSMSFRSIGKVEVNPGLFETIHQAIRGKRRLQVRYYTAGRDALGERRIDPYHVTLRGGGWYLVGFDHFRQEVRTFALARIRKAGVLDEEFDRPAAFDIDEHFAGSFGVVPDERMHEVAVRFEPQTARWVRERTWCETQTVEETPDDAVIIRFTASGLREIAAWTLSFGAAAQVLGPQELREMVIEEARKIVEKGKKSVARTGDVGVGGV